MKIKSRTRKKGVKIIYSYNIIENISSLKTPQSNSVKLLRFIRDNDIEVVYLNIYFQELSIYTVGSKLCETIKRNKNIIDEYSFKDKLLFIRIRFDDPEKMTEDTGKIIKLFNENNLDFIELGYSFNRLYTVLNEEDKEKFIQICEKDR